MGFRHVDGGFPALTADKLVEPRGQGDCPTDKFEAQLFSGALFPPFFVAPLKIVFPKKGSIFFQGH